MSHSGVAELEIEGTTDAAERAAVEAILFTSVEPVPLDQLTQALGADQAKVRGWLEQLEHELETPHRGLQLVTVAGGYRLVTKGSVSEILRRHRQMTAAVRLSKAALETLAIVAYKQPVSRAQVGAVRGVNVDAVMRTLQQRGYIREVGKDPGPGQAVLYGTTPLFLEKLGLDSLADLPNLGDFVPSGDVVEALERGLAPEE